jgi:methylase of polypeptide subunit release factors
VDAAMTIDLGLAPVLGDVLCSAGFSFESVRRVLGAGAGGFADIAAGPLSMHRTRGGSRLENLIRLLVLGGSLRESEASDAMAGLGLDAAIRGGLLRRVEGGRIEAILAAVPYEDVVVLADFSRRPMGLVETAPDHVMGIGRSTLIPTKLLDGLRKDVQRPRPGRALDLGCGCGYLAIWCAGWAEHVIGTDVNPRAIELARFNAVLNGRANVEIRSGSLAEPVAHERFDVIVSNPPFVISPESAIVYRDGGAQLGAGPGRKFGDEFCSRVVQDAAALLAPGGIMVTTLNWAEKGEEDGEPWQKRLGSWVPPGNQAWVIRTDSQSVDAYAAMWIRHTMSGDAGWTEAKYFERFDAWMQYYDKLGIERIAYGQMIVRREGPAFIATDDVESTWIERGAVDAPAAMDGRANVALSTDSPTWETLAELLNRKWKFAASVEIQEVGDVARGARTVDVLIRGRPVCRRMRPEMWRVFTGVTGRVQLGRALEDGMAMAGLGQELRDTVAGIAWSMAREGVLVRAE